LADSGAAETNTADERKMAISPQQKAMYVLWYWEAKSVIQVQRCYRREYGEQAPGRQSIKRWLEQFQETGSVLHKKVAGRPSVDADAVEMVREAFQRSPSKSPHCASRELHLPRLTVQKILHRRLELHTQKIQIVQALEPDDGCCRKEFAMDMLDHIDNDNDFLDRVIFSDGSTFHMCGIVNRHNCRIWGSESPHAVREYERDSPKLNVWCALSRHEVIGPFFFQEKTVNSTNYLDMLELFAVPQMAHLQPNVFFQQDGAPPH
jgi:transposase